MIKFFRKIRQRLLSENKFSKYLFYAIGEIILVVIGILIALQINNWNQKKINRAEERNYYSNIKRQLNEDKNTIAANIDYNNNFLKQFKYAIEIIENNDRTLADTLAKISVNLLEFSDFHRQSNIYETMVNSGEIKLLKNQQIIEKLQLLEEKYILINKLEDTHSQAVLGFSVPAIVNTIKVYKMKVEDIEKLYSFEFQNLFTLLTNLMNEKNEVYEYTSDEISSINNLIDDEIGN
ncbi:hypothetical protein MBM09_12460 [Flaviramulus sp. BrNp1-15]|uniref:hypothetical protein n=1 Tax=Flaviramulus sp. BrNp1-15 TaxID=2916754 RepID=UPI001EE8EC5A|nr:hypothetical protein [Flaviramulus sp. BrNp1-15]ULC58721.1 hypothetical protein MBM09_12460 [Flaviramulus sp. BrNp1-15]